MEWDEKRKLKIALKIELIILFILLSTIYIDINGGWLFVQNLIPDFNTHYTILDISKLRWADLNEFKGKYVQIEGYYMGQSVPVDKYTLQELREMRGDWFILEIPDYIRKIPFIPKTYVFDVITKDLDKNNRQICIIVTMVCFDNPAKGLKQWDKVVVRGKIADVFTYKKFKFENLVLEYPNGYNVLLIHGSIEKVK